MAHVPTTNINALYANTTSSQAADPNLFDAAMQDIVATVNGNDDGRSGDLTTHKSAVTLDHPDGSVTTPKLADAVVTTSKLAPQAVTIDKLSPDIQSSTNLEVVNARVSVPSNKTYDTLKARLDDEIGILSKNGVSVLSYGAKCDGITDDSVAVQSAVNAASSAGGGVVLVPPGTTLIGVSINIPSNVTIRGAGIDVTIVRDHANLGGSQVFKAIGTSGSHITNIRFEKMTIRNGTATTGNPTTSKDGIRCEYVDNVSLFQVKFTEIKGNYGFVVKYSSGINVSQCIFYRVTYSCMTVLIQCVGIVVEDCTFDTTVSTSTTQNYLFATGGENLSEGTFFLKQLWVKNSRFLNNPTWEGIDCHGGEDIWIEDNYVENCATGINVGNSSGYVSNPVLKNVRIQRNTMYQLTGINGKPGIVLTGLWTAGSLANMAENIRVRDNYLNGFGGSAADTVGAINLYNVRDFIIEGNVMENFQQSGISLYYNCLDGRIHRNRFVGVTGGVDSARFCAIRLRSVGLFGIDIKENVLEAIAGKICNYFVYADQNYIALQLKDNNIKSVSTSLYGGSTVSVPTEYSSTPVSGLFGKYYDIVYNNAGKAGWAVASPKLGYGSLMSITMTVNGTAGQSTVTVASGEIRNIPEGMNITIAGAGASGGTLTAKVIKNDLVNTLTLDTSVVTSVTGASLAYVAPTFTAL